MPSRDECGPIGRLPFLSGRVVRPVVDGGDASFLKPNEVLTELHCQLPQLPLRGDGDWPPPSAADADLAEGWDWESRIPVVGTFGVDSSDDRVRDAERNRAIGYYDELPPMRSHRPVLHGEQSSPPGARQTTPVPNDVALRRARMHNLLQLLHRVKSDEALDRTSGFSEAEMCALLHAAIQDREEQVCIVPRPFTLGTPPAPAVWPRHIPPFPRDHARSPASNPLDSASTSEGEIETLMLGRRWIIGPVVTGNGPKAHWVLSLFDRARGELYIRDPGQPSDEARSGARQRRAKAICEQWAVFLHRLGLPHSFDYAVLGVPGDKGFARQALALATWVMEVMRNGTPNPKHAGVLAQRHAHLVSNIRIGVGADAPGIADDKAFHSALVDGTDADAQHRRAVGPYHMSLWIVVLSHQLGYGAKGDETPIPAVGGRSEMRRWWMLSLLFGLHFNIRDYRIRLINERTDPSSVPPLRFLTATGGPRFDNFRKKDPIKSVAEASEKVSNWLHVQSVSTSYQLYGRRGSSLEPSPTRDDASPQQRPGPRLSSPDQPPPSRDGVGRPASGAREAATRTVSRRRSVGTLPGGQSPPPPATQHAPVGDPAAGRPATPDPTSRGAAGARSGASSALRPRGVKRPPSGESQDSPRSAHGRRTRRRASPEGDPSPSPKAEGSSLDQGPGDDGADPDDGDVDLGHPFGLDSPPYLLSTPGAWGRSHVAPPSQPSGYYPPYEADDETGEI